MSRKDWGVLLGILGVGYFLRVVFLGQGALTFGYDQARDALVTQQILAGDIKILGPPASTPGLYHGVFYYYFLAPAYFISHSPLVAAYWNAIFNTAAILIVFYLAYLMTKRKLAGFLAALMLAISFEASQYAVWLSNPTLGIWTVPLIYLGLWAWVKEKKSWGAILVAMGLGLSIQAEVFLLYHLIPVLLWVWVGRKNVRIDQIILFGGVLVVTLLTMIVAEVKFGFKGISGALSLLATAESVRTAKSLGDFLVLFFNQVGKVFAFNTYPGNIGYGGVFVLVLIVASLVIWDKKNIAWEPFLASWLLSHLTVVSVGGTSTPFLLVGIGPGVSILVGIWIDKWWRSGQKAAAAVVMGILIYGNVSMILKENPYGQTIFSIQRDMLLSNEVLAIEYTYDRANGESFSVNTLTSPLWINNVWTYLYKEYGEKKYGYLPQWHGRDQVGQLSEGMLEEVKPETEIYFLILEPMQGIPPRYFEETVGAEDQVSELVEEKEFGELIVQKRRRLDGE